MIDGQVLYTQSAMDLNFHLGFMVAMLISIIFTILVPCRHPVAKPSDKARGVRGSSPATHGFTACESSKHGAGQHTASYGSIKGMRKDQLETMMRALNAARDEVVEEMLRRRNKK